MVEHNTAEQLFNLVQSNLNKDRDTLVTGIDHYITSQSDCQHTVLLYNQWSATYEQDLSFTGYHSHEQAAAMCAKYVKIDQRQDVRVLDVAAGTGQVGSQLVNVHGFQQVDALDGSSGMLEKARERGIYKNYFVEIVSDVPLSSVQEATYDVVVTTGSFLPGHMSAKCLPTMARTVKKDGYVILHMRTEYLSHPYLADVQDVIGQMEKNGIWKLVEKRLHENYFGPHSGTCFVMQKL